MKRYVYPAVLYSDSEGENFTIFFPDLDVVASGDNAEECFENGQKMLQAYFETAFKFSAFIPEPSVFTDVVKAYPKKQVIMADAMVDDKKDEDIKTRKGYKNFVKIFFGKN